MTKNSKNAVASEAPPKTTPKASGTQVKKRKVKKSQYHSFRLQRRIKQAGPGLPSAFIIFRQSIGVLKRNWKLFLLLTAIYGFVNFVVVQGFSSGSNISEIKDSLNGLFDGKIAQLLASFALFVYMLGTSGMAANATTGAYQFIWVVMVSLAFIWTFRQVYADRPVRVRDAFYRGMYPLVPFVLVLFVVALQFVPAILGGILYTSVANAGIAATGIETALWTIVFALLVLLSLYMICSAIFALYIVCLQDMTPMKALRSARALVVNRRWAVLRKIVFLPVALLLLGAVVMVPLIIFAAPIAGWAFFFVSMFGLTILHSYLYALYRELL